MSLLVTGIGELIERVPDRDRVEPAFAIEALEIAVVHGESHRSSERIDVRVHVEPLELPPRIARGRQESAHVAADLQPRAASRQVRSHATRLRAVHAPLCIEQSPQHGVREMLDGVRLAHVSATLRGIAIDQAAAAALHHAPRRWLRKRNAVHEPVWRRVWRQPSHVERPEQLGFDANVVRAGELRGVGLAADDAAGQLIAGHRADLERLCSVVSLQLPALE